MCIPMHLTAIKSGIQLMHHLYLFTHYAELRACAVALAMSRSTIFSVGIFVEMHMAVVLGPFCVEPGSLHRYGCNAHYVLLFLVTHLYLLWRQPTLYGYVRQIRG